MIFTYSYFLTFYLDHNFIRYDDNRRYIFPFPGSEGDDELPTESEDSSDSWSVKTDSSKLSTNSSVNRCVVVQNIQLITLFNRILVSIEFVLFQHFISSNRRATV